MKSNINDTPLRTYSTIPKSWDARPNLINYDKAESAIHIQDGWRDVVIPEIGANQKHGSLFFDKANDVVTSEVIDKTPEELEAERQASIPFSISKLQAMVQLSRMGIKDAVLAVVANSENAEVQLYFEHAATWERASPIINNFAPMLGMSQGDLDDFFILAERIN